MTIRTVLLLHLFLFYFQVQAQITGCTDPLAINYNSSATINDGSCAYNSVTITPFASYTLSTQLNETSGLIYWNDTIYTHNDNSDKRLYALDTLNGTILKTYSLQALTNIDWEEIAQDSASIYIGDFGNNANGNRTNLRILRINKASLWASTPVADTINFNYSNQTTYTASGSNNTDFDCEAFIVTTDSIFLFTKQWVSKKTSVYGLPKTPGTYTAQLKQTLDVQGLITGAYYNKDSNAVVLCGYSNVLQPFLYILYDYPTNSFFNGNKRKVSLNLPFHQTEGITSKNGRQFYISNEYFTQAPFVTVPQKLHKIDLDQILYPSLINSVFSSTKDSHQPVSVYPSITNDHITINFHKTEPYVNFKLLDHLSNGVISGQISTPNTTIDLNTLSAGLYILRVSSGTKYYTFKIIKH